VWRGVLTGDMILGGVGANDETVFETSQEYVVSIMVLSTTQGFF
jgi:hypothetical protein